MFYEFVMDQTNEELKDFFTSINVPNDLKKDYITKCASEFISPKMLLNLNQACLKKLNIKKIDRLAIRKQSKQQAVAGSSNETKFKNRIKKMKKRIRVLKRIIRQTRRKVQRLNRWMAQIAFARIASQMRELFDSDRQKYEAFAEHYGYDIAELDNCLSYVMNAPFTED